MATVAGLVTMEEYLRTAYEPDAEYVDGLVEERDMGQWDHSSWQDAIQAWFRQHAKEWNVRIHLELRLRVAPTCVRIPDVAVISRDQPVEQVPTQPPFAVFEVLSPEDRLPRVMRRLEDFARMGIRHIWVIDPETNSFFQFADGKLSPATHFGAPGDSIRFAMSEIEALLD